MKLSYTLRKEFGCHSTRASRRIPVLFFHALKTGLMKLMNPQGQDLIEEWRGAGKETGFSARHAENDSLEEPGMSTDLLALKLTRYPRGS